MKTFQTLEELITEIKQDKRHPHLPSAQRFPVRLIFLPHLWMLKPLVNELHALHIQNAELSQVLPGDDKWLTVDGVMNVVKNLNPDQDHVILPFSEVVRFFTDDQLQAVLNRLATEFENTGTIRKDRRLYFPLVGIHERFEMVFWRHFHRSQEWAPIWRVAGDSQKVRVYLIDRHTQTPPELLSLPNTKTWLHLWKHDRTDTVLCASKILAFLAPNAVPDHAFDLKKIQNAKELISALYDVRIPIPYVTEDSAHWDWLWTTVSGKRFNDFDDFDDLVKHVFNRRKIEHDRLLSLWIDGQSPSQRWLLKWYAISRHDWKESYLVQIFEKIATFEDDKLIKAIWLHIFESNAYPHDWIQERRELLLKLFKHFGSKVTLVGDELRDALERFGAKFPDNPWKKAELCTGITVGERTFIIKLLQAMGISEKPQHKALNAVYPALSYYLSEVRIDKLKRENAWVDEYFREYRWSKLRHTESPRLQELLLTKNANKASFYQWYYAFPAPQAHPLFQETGLEKIVWIDGLGLEWLPLFVRLIEEHGLTLEKSGVARTNLPSITECNRFEKAQHIMLLDKFIHDRNHYAYPDDLVTEIEILTTIVHDYLVSGERTLIVSDHGLSVFTTKSFGNTKKYDFAKADHEGRCMWIDTDFLDDDDFFVHTPEEPSCGKGKKCLIPLKRVSLHNTPRREVHGGATPEEVLVPLLLVSKGTKTQTEDAMVYIIKVVQHDISVRSPRMTFSIEPEPEFNPIVQDSEGNVVRIEYHEQTKMWNMNLPGFRPGDHVLNIEIGRWQGQITFSLKGGMQEKNLF